MMRSTLCVLLAAACVLADESRGSKRPYIADAVGNTIPPPSAGPATVGSPVNLLTPDRYEFYTFDESGELVKRLMTLQEIQAIVAAGEEAEGLVTFANDNQPTIAFNFSQPPYTKVHSVVTNVQNVLKAQMEAHKNNPQTNPTLDTPDVSDSWSLILPSIFGNTGVDIVPDKTSGSFSTPETETFEFDRINFDENLSKEGSNPISSTTTVEKEREKPAATEKIPSTNDFIKEVTSTAKPTLKTTTISTTPEQTTTTTTTTTKKPITTTSTTTTTTTTTTTQKPTTTTTTTTTIKPSTKTTSVPRTTQTSKRPSTTPKPRTTISTTRLTTTAKPTVKITAKPTTFRPHSTTRRQVSTTTPRTENNPTKIQVKTTSTGFSTTEKSSPIYEKISTFIPVSTAAYITERSTQKPVQTTKRITTLESTTKKTFVSTSKIPLITTVTQKAKPTITTYKPTSTTPTPISSSPKSEILDKENSTTITTQSVSPSATVSSTELMSAVSQPPKSSPEKNTTPEENNDIKVNEPILPMFDVAQSISQIASDLGSTNYQPIPTTSNLLETTNAMNMDLESKESLELEIPSDTKNGSEKKPNANIDKNESDNFVKISTINPHQENNDKEASSEVKNTQDKKSEVVATTTVIIPENIATTSTGTPIDPILSESMDDLLSQVVNQAPQSIIDSETNFKDQAELSTTEKSVETTTTVITLGTEITSQTILDNNSSSTTEKLPDIANRNGNIESNVNEPFKNVSLEITEKEKEQDIKNHEINDSDKIPMSIQSSNEKVSSSSQNNDEPVNPSKHDNGLQTLTLQKQDNNVVVVNAPKEPLKANVPTLTQVASQQPILYKTNTEDTNNRIQSADSEKVPLAKIDEFKKKIQTVNINNKEIANERNNSWKLIPTVSPPKSDEIPKNKFKIENNHETPPFKDFPEKYDGLEVTVKDLSEDVAQFTELCNELAFRYWKAVTENIPDKRSFVFSPFSITSMLAMMFMGAKGATSGEMNEILKLDDMVTFNPHFILKNISDSIETTPESGVAVSTFIRELYSDRNKGKILTFYKERAQHFYNGHVEEVNFKLISDIIRRRTNLLVKRYTWGKIAEYMKANTITMQPPLAALSTNIFQTDCTGSSVEGRDGEMYFMVSPSVRQRRLVPVPAVLYKKGFLAGYDPVLDATAATVGNFNSIISTIYVMPGEPGDITYVEDLNLKSLEEALLDFKPRSQTYGGILRSLGPRVGVELQIPRFSHKSIFNTSSILKKMGLKDLFDAEHADLGGLNGPTKDLYLSDMIETTSFVSCGEGVIGEQHHIEEYPENLESTRRRRTSRWTTGFDEPRDYQRAFHDPHDVGEAMNLPLHLRPRQARVPGREAQTARVKFNRPFFYFVRHNPTGMLLYVGRYNPRLLP